MDKAIYDGENSAETAATPDVTPEHIYLGRREILSKLGFAGAAALAGSLLSLDGEALAAGEPGLKLPTKTSYVVNDPERPVTKEELATSYNNYYEFDLDKKGVKAVAEAWKRPEKWTLQIEGLVEKPLALDLAEILKTSTVEDRVYRFRCVEAWSMVLPWTGIPLAEIVARAKPTAKAKYLKFVTYVDDKAMPNIKKMPYYPWPYTEGLTLEEARHPLALLATGLYGKPLRNQNGAPVRLVVPWKYGFKSAKSIARIEFTSEMPKTLWSQLNPSEYGFYANVNPDVSHPRWSQARETRIDGSFIPKKIATLKFNGYEKEVAGLYASLDLKKNY